MNIGFAGSPIFAANVLTHLIGSGFNISFVMTKVDSKSGRGMNLSFSSVKKIALLHNIKIYQPLSLRLESAANTDMLSNIDSVDVLVVVAYGMILPSYIVNKKLCLNVHASILPSLRGAAPIQRAIQFGHSKTGISIMHMNEGLDTGDVLKADHINIEQKETSETLHNKLSNLACISIVDTLNNLDSLVLNKISQTSMDLNKLSYAHKIDKQEAKINIAEFENAYALDRIIRAFNPFPIARINDCKIFKSEPINIVHSHTAGHLMSFNRHDGIIVACNNNTALKILNLQTIHKNKISALDFINGCRKDIKNITNIKDIFQVN
jgi:methionyl-tRNA formyltransferase